MLLNCQSWYLLTSRNSTLFSLLQLKRQNTYCLFNLPWSCNVSLPWLPWLLWLPGIVREITRVKDTILPVRNNHFKETVISSLCLISDKSLRGGRGGEGNALSRRTLCLLQLTAVGCVTYTVDQVRIQPQTLRHTPSFIRMYSSSTNVLFFWLVFFKKSKNQWNNLLRTRWKSTTKRRMYPSVLSVILSKTSTRIQNDS